MAEKKNTLLRKLRVHTSIVDKCRILTKLVKLCHTNDEFDDVIRYCEQILELDSSNDFAYNQIFRTNYFRSDLFAKQMQKQERIGNLRALIDRNGAIIDEFETMEKRNENEANISYTLMKMKRERLINTVQNSRAQLGILNDKASPFWDAELVPQPPTPPYRKIVSELLHFNLENHRKFIQLNTDESVPLNKILNDKIHDLVFGYTSNILRANITIPMEVQQLCLNYYMSHTNNEIYEDFPLNNKGISEVISFVSNVLSPNQSLSLSLTTLIKSLHFVISQKETWRYFHFYLSLLSYAAQQLHIYPLLQSAKDDGIFWGNDYNIAILKLTQFPEIQCSDIPLRQQKTYIPNLLYALLNTNSEQYCQYFNLSLNVYNRSLTNNNTWFQYFMSTENDMKYVRIACGFIAKSGSVIRSSVHSLQFLNRKVSFENREMTFLPWIWLCKELESRTNDMPKEELCMREIACLTMKILDIAAKKYTKFAVKYCAMYEMQVLHLVFVSTELEPDFLNFNSTDVDFCGYALFILCALRTEKYSLVGWKLLGYHIQQFRSRSRSLEHLVFGYTSNRAIPMQVQQLCLNYYVSHINNAHLQNLAHFINSKAGLLKKTVVSYIRMIKSNTYKNFETAELALKEASQVCSEIHSLINERIINKNDMTAFGCLYEKMTKTKLIKPFLEEN